MADDTTVVQLGHLQGQVSVLPVTLLGCSWPSASRLVPSVHLDVCVCVCIYCKCALPD